MACWHVAPRGGRGATLGQQSVNSERLMCGRYALTDPQQIVERFGFMDWSDKRPAPRFNIAPSQEILTIVQMPLEEPRPQTAVWGLKPFWLQKGKAPPINARVEAIGASAMFRDAQRCLIPATGFYEWCQKRPLHIRRRDGKVFMFAGLWLPANASGGPPTAAIITTQPNDLMATIHTRMPAILRPADELRWLDPTLDAAEAQRIAAESLPAALMEAYAVKPLVNSWENEGPALLDPAQPEEAAQPQQMGLL
jgi:putative SOS response-associated peptidase YedK